MPLRVSGERALAGRLESSEISDDVGMFRYLSHVAA